MTDEEPHWKQGMTRYDEKDYEGAIAEWREASRLDPNAGYLHSNIGIALWGLGQREAAIAEWRKAVFVEPSFTGSYVDLANALSASGDSLEALAAVQTALDFFPENVGLYRHLGYHLSIQARQDNDNGKLEAAEAAFQQALDLDPTDAYALRSLAAIQWNLKKKKAAFNTLKTAIAAYPDDVKAYIQLGDYQGRLRDLWGMIQTAYAIGSLPASAERDQYYAKCNKSAVQAGKVLLTGAGILGVLVGGWLWYRRRG